MRELMPVSRRRFGQGLGASLALAGLPSAASSHAGSHEVRVRISGFAFDPKRLEINAGDTVVWVNEDLVPHTATATDGSWDTGTLETTMEARIVFGSPGDFSYVCAFHPHMTGTISIKKKTPG